MDLDVCNYQPAFTRCTQTNMERTEHGVLQPYFVLSCAYYSVYFTVILVFPTAWL